MLPMDKEEARLQPGRLPLEAESLKADEEDDVIARADLLPTD